MVLVSTVPSTALICWRKLVYSLYVLLCWTHASLWPLQDMSDVQVSAMRFTQPVHLLQIMGLLTLCLLFSLNCFNTTFNSVFACVGRLVSYL